jgi:TIGR03009 family protein
MIAGAALLVVVPSIFAQQGPLGPQAPMAPQGQPQAQAQPQGQAPVAPPPAGAPFQLSPQEQQDLDELLKVWHQRSAQIQNLGCKYNLWDVDGTFNRTSEMAGVIAYERPDKGRYQVTHQKVAGADGQPQWAKVDGEHWVSNGKSIFEFRHPEKTLIEHQLPDNLQGAGIRNGPLPFLFVANPQELKNRCWMRLITTQQQHQQGEIWIQAFPRYQQDAGNFSKAELILKRDTMLPYGVRMTKPDGKSSVTYVFTEYQLNNNAQGNNWIQWWGNDPWTPRAPSGWQKKVEAALAPAAAQPADQGPRRPLGGIFGGG